jgi:hypothetical protein
VHPKTTEKSFILAQKERSGSCHRASHHLLETVFKDLQYLKQIKASFLSMTSMVLVPGVSVMSLVQPESTCKYFDGGIETIEGT